MSPTVTIGLPVYNGERYLAEAVQSVLNQTYQNLELVISDNGSTDNTEAICRAYAASDERVRYYRSEVNRGAAWNYNRTVELGRGEYFRWLAHDDKFAPDLIEKSVMVLEENPQIPVCITWFVDIDEDGNEIEIKQSKLMFNDKRPEKRFLSMSELRPSNNCEEVFGLIRMSSLRQTAMIANYVDSDRTLIAELGLHGPFHEIPEPLFLHRLHTTSSVVVNPTRQERTVWFDPSKKGKLVFPHWRQMKELFATIKRSPLPFGDKLKTYSQMVPWMVSSRRRLRSDLVWAYKKIASN